MKTKNSATTIVDLKEVLNGSEFVIPIPSSIPPGAKITDVDIDMEGKCGCGGNLIKSKTEKMTWVCSKDNWWRFWSRKHCKLVIEHGFLPPPQGNA